MLFVSKVQKYNEIYIETSINFIRNAKGGIVEKVELQIKSIIDEYINPALAEHSGSISFVSLDQEGDSWVINVKFHGECVRCPSSFSQTLKSIEMFFSEEMSAPGIKVKNIGE